MITLIATASNEQSNGLKEVTTSISQLNDTTNYNSAIAQTTASEAKKLDEQSLIQVNLIVNLSNLIN